MWSTMSQATQVSVILIAVLVISCAYAFHSFNLLLSGSLASAIFVIFLFNQFHVSPKKNTLQVNSETKAQDDSPASSTPNPTCQCGQPKTNFVDNPKTIPDDPTSNTETDLSEPRSSFSQQNTIGSDVMTSEPEEVDGMDQLATKSLLQRRQVRDLRVSTDHHILPKSSSFSTPLRPQHRLSPYLRGSLSETTSAKSPTVIPPDFSLATKRPLRRRHSTILVTAQRLEKDAKSKEVLSSKVPSAISRRAFGFEPIYGEWEKRAQAEAHSPGPQQNNKNQNFSIHPQ
ncbi:hypothetical protein K450DRAFT_230647 [Umbelopsis ramanniana AG]|uniref:Uncharacterized protein n=1 Tax=Umbelopsis ramanniana AG TaxID=1314678 RepID=A0AAD5EEP9_UMBRA|nr:uncharacterized protein K450DRAFT_230647 [Umbelopsis ramanniana AG]KAI8581675.1 hypothetical protein K450DRAFT_230647 [Umbelopsis ramanniana AG]